MDSEAPRSFSPAESIVDSVDQARAYLAILKVRGALPAQLSPCSSSSIVEQARAYLARSSSPSSLQSLTQGCDPSACALEPCFGSHVSECLNHNENVPISNPPLSPSYIVNMEPSSEGFASCEDATVVLTKVPFFKNYTRLDGWQQCPIAVPCLFLEISLFILALAS